MTTITLNKLLPWDGNVRKTGASVGLEELIASIASHGLLQSLVVKPASGKKNAGKYHVVAGQRRLMALTELAKRGTIANDYPVPCHAISKGAQAEEISLAENTVRLQMHPADQFEAFHALNEAGTEVPDIAARFGVAESTVQKLLKLARVSPKILKAYRDGELTLAQVQAFASTDDQKAQERVFKEINPECTDADDIRDALTPEDEIPATDKRVKYVGLEAYEKAGGKTRRDLFTEGDDGIFLLDPAILDDLVTNKLAKSEKKLLAEGWGWVEIDPDLSWEKRNSFGRITEEMSLTPAQQKQYDDLSAEAEQLNDAWYESGDDEKPERLQQVEDLIEDIENAGSDYIPEQKAIAGCLITIDREGDIDILRGYVKPEDKPRLAALHKAQQAGDPEAVQAALEDAKNATPAPKGMPASLIEFLTQHRSLALQAQLAVNPHIGLATAVHVIADGIFYKGRRAGSCLNSFASQQYHPLAKDSMANDEIDREQSLWRDRLPGDEEQFFQWCLEQDRDTLIALLTYCVALSVDATKRKQDKPGSGKFHHAAKLASALKLDMSAYFRPDAGNYFSRISKDMIIADLKEITGKDASPAMLKMKKTQLAALAAKAVGETKWLPAILRPQDPPQS